MANIPFTPVPPSSAFRGYAVTKSDSVLLPLGVTGLWVGGTGDVKVTFSGQEDADAVVFTAVPAGTFLPFCIDKVWSTGTSATLMVAVGV